MANGKSANWRELYPFESHWAPVAGGRLHYVDEGEGPPVLLCHGNPTWSFMYRDLIVALRQAGRRAIAVDNLGCGLSDKPQDYPYRLRNHIDNLAAVVERTGIERFDLIVHDWGGAIGCGLAVSCPERIRRMVATNTAAFLADRCPWRIRACRLPGFGALAVRGLNGFVRAALRAATAHPERLSAAVRAGYLAPYDSYRNRIATLRFVQDIPLSASHPTYPTLAAVEQGLRGLAAKPLLLAWGMQDFCFDEPFLARWLEFFPQASVSRHPEAGHYLLEDAGPAVVAEILAFLEASA